MKKAQKRKFQMWVVVTHKCGELLGSFWPEDDDSNIEIRCPKCHIIVSLKHRLLVNIIDKNIGRVCGKLWAYGNNDCSYVYRRLEYKV